MDLIPPALVVNRYFANQRAHVNELDVKSEEAARQIEEYIDEHAVEDGLLFDAMDDDKITKALSTARLKEAKREGIDLDEIDALEHLISLYDAESGAKKTAKEAQATLDLATLKKYGELSEHDTTQLVLDDKWAATITQRIGGKVNSLTLALLNRIQQLGERYAETVGSRWPATWPIWGSNDCDCGTCATRPVTTTSAPLWHQCRRSSPNPWHLDLHSDHRH
jgi:type I restriction enzyme M protein